MLTSSGARRRAWGTESTSSTGESVPRMIDLILQARRSIHLSTLILADEVARRSCPASRRSRAGVEVRVLVDALFRFRRLGAIAHAAGCRARHAVHAVVASAFAGSAT